MAEIGVAVVIVMGVTGSGKTTVGTRLAQRLGWRFVEGDVLHSAANREKMSRGIPLTDDDRLPWLRSIRDEVLAIRKRGERAVVACSALKQFYREAMLSGVRREEVRIVFLKGSPRLIAERLAARTGHFMNPALLGSQFETLEPPADAIEIDIEKSADEEVDRIVRELSLRPTP